MLEESFDKYTSNYDLSNECIKLKYNHSYRVMNLSIKFATKLGFSKEDIELAKIIGLLHDLGRFEQYRVYHTFDDSKSIDHANYSVEQLFTKGLIKNFTNREDDYDIIKFAIKNHNKYKIESCNNEKMIRFAKLIRDVDKIDIIYLLGYLGELDSKATDDSISSEVFDCIKKRSSVPLKIRKNNNDDLVSKFSYVFDMYNDICLPLMKEYMYYFYQRIEKDNIFKNVYEEINKYLDERIDNYVRNKI